MENNEIKITKLPDTGVHKATLLIKEEFEERGYKFDVHAEDGISLVRLGFNGEKMPHQKYVFVSRDDDNDVFVRSDTIVNLPAAKLPAAHRLLNEYNNRFRFVRFCLDRRNGVRLEYEMPIETADEDVGRIARDILMCMTVVTDEVYPELMRLVWAD